MITASMYGKKALNSFVFSAGRNSPTVHQLARSRSPQNPKRYVRFVLLVAVLISSLRRYISCLFCSDVSNSPLGLVLVYYKVISSNRSVL